VIVAQYALFWQSTIGLLCTCFLDNTPPLLNVLPMYLVVIAWLYVTLMMAIAEATSPVGSLLGASVTFVFYGLLPLGIVVYILATPARKRARREQAERAAMRAGAQTGETTSDSVAPDATGETAAAAQTCGVTAVREKR
jgi:predicted membrane channel-forming protein YqfA (hemolysin III family)